jgi:hypothetical protein
MAAIINTDDSRPQIGGFENENLKYVSKYEIDSTQKMLREYKQKEKETIFTMTLGEIVKETVQCIADFGDEYQKKLYSVELDFQLRNRNSFFDNILKYFMAFLVYLMDKDNVLYMGILLFILSIIIYFFNISG